MGNRDYTVQKSQSNEPKQRVATRAEGAAEREAAKSTARRMKAALLTIIERPLQRRRNYIAIAVKRDSEQERKAQYD